jgi:type I restriction enzyme S subunit
MSKKVLVAPHDLQKNFSIFLKDKLLLIESLKEQNFNLAKQRDLLLPRLMSGKLEV